MAWLLRLWRVRVVFGGAGWAWEVEDEARLIVLLGGAGVEFVLDGREGAQELSCDRGEDGGATGGKLVLDDEGGDGGKEVVDLHGGLGVFELAGELGGEVGVIGGVGGSQDVAVAISGGWVAVEAAAAAIAVAGTTADVASGGDPGALAF